MNVVKTVKQLRQTLPNFKGKLIGFVPTMGYLHEGHLSLIRKARKECGAVVVSIFVNPLQFGPQEDFATYPRDLAHDAELAEQAGVDVLFIPGEGEMYPRPPLTKISVATVTDGLCGVSRPGHFDGVATVVAKLFHLIQPQRAYFGMKDIQQLAVVERMVADLNMPVKIVPCATVREPDGLAMSSRNVHLSGEERRQARILYQALQFAQEKIKNKEWQSGRQVERAVYEKIATQPLARIDYVEMRTFPEMARVTMVGDDTYVVAAAVTFGQTRLIDNVLIPGKEGDGCIAR